MTKTQIQLPDDLYRRVKQFSAQREWSLAETFRRAVEQFCDRHASDPVPADDWSLPAPRDMGWQGLNPAEIHAAALDDMEPTTRRQTGMKKRRGR
jgi:hypothetical protein